MNPGLRLLPAILMGCACLAACGTTETPQKWGDVPGGRFIADHEGRALILHGMNVMSANKSGPSHLPTASFDQARVISQKWGFNAVRFLILWSGLEPQPGQYNETYFEGIRAWLDFWHTQQVYVILDMHQDVYAAKFCCDGAPDWAIRDDGLPFELHDAWFLNYFEPAVQRSFDNFWDHEGPHADLQQHYQALWQEVARRFKDHPALLGYDIINEPHPGSYFDPLEAIGMENPDSRSPEFDLTRLGPFYQRTIDAIRTVDQDNWVFFEPRYGAPGNGFPSWIEKLHDGRPGQPRIAYFPHLYSIKLENDQAYDPENDPCLANWEQARRADVARQNAPLALGEWGLSPDWPNALLFMEQVCQLADRMLAGWTYWSFDPGGWAITQSDYTERPSADILVRPYPRAVAGVPTLIAFDTDSKEFQLEFQDNDQSRGATELHLPRRHYPDGFTIEIDGESAPATTFQWDQERDLVRLTVAKSGGSHRVVVRPVTSPAARRPPWP